MSYFVSRSTSDGATAAPATEAVAVVVSATFVAIEPLPHTRTVSRKARDTSA